MYVVDYVIDMVYIIFRRSKKITISQGIIYG